MATDLIAKASIGIEASREKVWAALVSPAAIEQYMFGAKVTTDWKVGSAITWTGQWQGRKYQGLKEYVERAEE